MVAGSNSPSTTPRASSSATATAPPSIRSPKVAQPDGERLDAPAGQAPLDGGPDPHDHLARDRLGVTGADRQKPAGAQLPAATIADRSARP
jgi:hypothetical protein